MPIQPRLGVLCPPVARRQLPGERAGLCFGRGRVSIEAGSLRRLLRSGLGSGLDLGIERFRGVEVWPRGPERFLGSNQPCVGRGKGGCLLGVSLLGLAKRFLESDQRRRLSLERLCCGVGALDFGAQRLGGAHGLEFGPAGLCGIPGIPGDRKFGLGLGLFDPLGRKVGIPALAGFELLYQGVLVSKLGLEFGHGPLERRPRLGIERLEASHGLLVDCHRILGILGFLGGAHGEVAVDLGAGHALEQLGSLGALGLEERRKVTLRQQDGLLELLESQAQPRRDGVERFGLRARQIDACLEIGECQVFGLDDAIGFLPGAPDGPPGAVRPGIDSQEVDFGKSGHGAPAHERSRVAVLEAAFAFGPDRHAALVAQAWRPVEQGQAQGVEQGALACPRGTGNGEQAHLAQRTARKVHLELARQARQVAAADGQDLHAGTSSPRRTSSSRSWKAASRSGGGSFPTVFA